MLFNKCFPIVDTCLSCEDIARQSCTMVRRWRLFAFFKLFQRAAYSTYQTCTLNSQYGDIMCGSMVDIQSPTTEIRRGKERRLVGRSSPYYHGIWRRYCCLTSFFPIVDTCLSCEDIARQSCPMVPRWQIFGDLLRPVFSASRVQHISDLHSKFALSHTMWGSMVDIQSATAEIRR